MSARDHGLQPERTTLSRRRTGWSMAIVALLCLRGWGHHGQWEYALGGLLLALGAAGLYTGLLRRHLWLAAVLVSASALLLCLR